MSIYALADLLLWYIWLNFNVIIKHMLPGQPPVRARLSGNGIVLFTDEFPFSCRFCRWTRSCLERRIIKRFHPKNVTQFDRYSGGSFMIWGGTSHYGKTNLITVNGNLNSQPYCEGILVLEVVSFLDQGQVTIFQQDKCSTAHPKRDPKRF
jgi:hypothetical protein